MADRPLVSVVLPVFDRQQQGERAIASALEQTMSDIEIVVVDDASRPPFSLPDTQAEDGRVTLIRHAANAGAAAARNTGIDAARGTWIAFLDSDDRWRPDKLARQLELVAGRGSELVCCATGFSLQNPASGAKRDVVPIESRDASDFAAGCWFAPGSTSLLPRAAFASVGMFDTGLRRLEDLDWFIRFGLAGGVLRVVPRVEAVIETGHRPSVAAVDDAASFLSGKWLDRSERLPARPRRYLSAYLALERASVRRSAGDCHGTLRWLANSFFAAPRTSLHLRRWWRPTDDGTENDG